MPRRCQNELLDALMAQQGYTVSSLAQKVGLCDAVILKARANRGLATETVEKLCTALHCDAASIGYSLQGLALQNTTNQGANQ
jgi:DNA-binding Xre family transcriptional regulator